MTGSLFRKIAFHSLRAYDQSLTSPAICSDRLEYWCDDPTGHVVATFPNGPAAWSLWIEVFRDLDHGPLETKEVVHAFPAERKVEILLDVGSLAIGDYGIRLALLDAG